MLSQQGVSACDLVTSSPCAPVGTWLFHQHKSRKAHTLGIFNLPVAARPPDRRPLPPINTSLQPVTPETSLTRQTSHDTALSSPHHGAASRSQLAGVACPFLCPTGDGGGEVSFQRYLSVEYVCSSVVVHSLPSSDTLFKSLSMIVQIEEVNRIPDRNRPTLTDLYPKASPANEASESDMYFRTVTNLPFSLFVAGNMGYLSSKHGSRLFTYL